jgi:hypothetical protein
VQDAPFFVEKLQVKVLPCVVVFLHGVAVDRIVGFDSLGAADDFPTLQVRTYTHRAHLPHRECNSAQHVSLLNRLSPGKEAAAEQRRCRLLDSGLEQAGSWC